MAAVEPTTIVDTRARAAHVRSPTLFVSLVDGRAIHWPDLDEDIGVAPLLTTAR